MNMPSADEHPEVVAEYLGEELAQGRLVEQDAGGNGRVSGRSHQSFLVSSPRRAKPGLVATHLWACHP